MVNKTVDKLTIGICPMLMRGMNIGKMCTKRVIYVQVAPGIVLMARLGMPTKVCRQLSIIGLSIIGLFGVVLLMRVSSRRSLSIEMA